MLSSLYNNTYFNRLSVKAINCSFIIFTGIRMSVHVKKILLENKNFD